MHKEHFLFVNSLIFYRSLDHKSFKTMAMYLLYSATYSQVPQTSVIDTRIKEQLFREKWISKKHCVLELDPSSKKFIRCRCSKTDNDFTLVNWKDPDTI